MISSVGICAKRTNIHIWILSQLENWRYQQIGCTALSGEIVMRTIIDENNIWEEEREKSLNGHSTNRCTPFLVCKLILVRYTCGHRRIREFGENDAIENTIGIWNWGKIIIRGIIWLERFARKVSMEHLLEKIVRLARSKTFLSLWEITESYQRGSVSDWDQKEKKRNSEYLMREVSILSKSVSHEDLPSLLFSGGKKTVDRIESENWNNIILG